MILVAGGTGTLGTEVVRLLAGRRLRVLTRDRARARHLAPDVEIVEGDVRTDVARAVDGCATVISLVHGFVGAGPDAIDRDGNRRLIRAAKNAGVPRFILMSVQGAAPDHPMSLHRAKYAAEQELRDSGVPFTIIRPTAFLETWLSVIGAPLQTSGHALVFGPGHNPINFVSVRDVAALAVLAIEGDELANQIIDIGGPENLGFEDIAKRLIEGAGRPGHIKRIPLPVLRAMSWLARPFSPTFARQAHAAVVMNTKDMTFDVSARTQLPSLPLTRLDDVLGSRILSRT